MVIFLELNLSPRKGRNLRIPFTLTHHSHNVTVKNITLKNSKILQNDLEISQIFSFPSLVYFKRDKSINKFLVRSALTSDRQPGTFKCKRSRCKTFICETPTRSHDLNGPSKSVIDLHASPVVLSSA